MSFGRISPPKELSRYIECFWIVEDADSTPTIQKIIPDGFPEMIFHFGDPYLIKLKSKWSKQSSSLLGGQITKHFYLKNTGISSILGIKFRPAALGLLFDIDMHPLTDRVVSLRSLGHPDINVIENLVKKADGHMANINTVSEYLSKNLRVIDDRGINNAVEKILSSNGTISVNDICRDSGCSERQLERLFRKYIGLSPKLYSRIVRFAYIFQHMQGSKKMNGSELGIASGYYDQSHFIRNFKAFTGEDPSQYFFNQPTLANFFLKKK
jgi:AraC-like DNA-binding protein